MQIRLTVKGRTFVLTIGRDLPYSKSIYLITIMEEFYYNMEEEYATFIKGFFK